MVTIPDIAVGGGAVYILGLHLYLAYRIGKAKVERNTLSAEEADIREPAS
jgi:hypothetical protein